MQEYKLWSIHDFLGGQQIFNLLDDGGDVHIDHTRLLFTFYLLEETSNSEQGEQSQLGIRQPRVICEAN